MKESIPIVLGCIALVSLAATVPAERTKTQLTITWSGEPFEMPVFPSGRTTWYYPTDMSVDDGGTYSQDPSEIWHDSKETTSKKAEIYAGAKSKDAVWDSAWADVAMWRDFTMYYSTSVDFEITFDLDDSTSYEESGSVQYFNAYLIVTDLTTGGQVGSSYYRWDNPGGTWNVSQVTGYGTFDSIAEHSYRIWMKFKWVSQSNSNAIAQGSSWGNPPYVEWAYCWIEY